MTTLRYRFSKRIAELRRFSGMKQATFADAIGLTLKQAGEIERGNSFPKPEKLEVIAKALNVPLKELFDFSKARYFPNPPVMPATETKRVPKKTRKTQGS